MRSFVHFILEPFYKILGVAISEEKKDLEPILTRLNVFLHKKDYLMDIKPLVRLILGSLLGNLACLIDATLIHIPSAKQNTAEKVTSYYKGAGTEMSDKI